MPAASISPLSVCLLKSSLLQMLPRLPVLQGLPRTLPPLKNEIPSPISRVPVQLRVIQEVLKCLEH